MHFLLAFLLVLLIEESSGVFSKLLCYFLALPFECSYPYYPYTIDIVYKNQASSQAIEVYQIRNNSVAWVTSLYGYGKDNLIERTNICLKSGLYQFVCSSRYFYTYRLRNLIGRLYSSWDYGSHFEVKAFGVTPVLHGRVDVGQLSVYYLYRIFS